MYDKTNLYIVSFIREYMYVVFNYSNIIIKHKIFFYAIKIELFECRNMILWQETFLILLMHFVSIYLFVILFLVWNSDGL